MLGSSVMASNTAAGSRLFIYEVKGLRQTDETDQAASQIRTSSTTLFPIPLSRMNRFMQRIGCLGGEIVAIHDSWDAATQAQARGEGSAEASESHME